MCRSKMAIDVAEPNQPSPTSRTKKPTEQQRSSRPSSSGGVPLTHLFPSTFDHSTDNATTTNYTSTSYEDSSRASISSLRSSLPKTANTYESSTSNPSANNVITPNYTSTSYADSSRASISTLREFLPQTAHIYDFTEICAATKNFHTKKYALSSTASWRCTLRGKDVVVFQRKFHISMETSQLRERLSVFYRIHHMSIIELFGASISNDHVYLVYEFINGVNLANCLRNPKHPNYTVLSTWMSRMQVLIDLARGLDYIHNFTVGQNIGIVHNHIKSSSIVITEPSFIAKICHFGTAQLCGETDENMLLKPSPTRDKGKGEITEIVEGKSSYSPSKKPELKSSDSRNMQFEGVRGYMSPEFQSTGIGTQKSDVYAFGVVILELLSGQEPLKYKFHKESGDFRRTSVIETAREAIEGGGCGGGGGGEEWGCDGRLRMWVDRRLKDSYPVEVAERLTRAALECVHVDPDKRPDMRYMERMISELYLKSRISSGAILGSSRVGSQVS